MITTPLFTEDVQKWKCVGRPLTNDNWVFSESFRKPFHLILRVSILLQNDHKVIAVPISSLPFPTFANCCFNNFPSLSFEEKTQVLTLQCSRYHPFTIFPWVTHPAAEITSPSWPSLATTDSSCFKQKKMNALSSSFSSVLVSLRTY